jgi:pimeloyl-ACP methyl ester carboxylesterase
VIPLDSPPEHGALAPGQHNLASRDGVRLAVRVEGHGQPMLLCNGLYCSTHYFVRLAPFFSQTYRVVQFDYRGHGVSADPPDPSSVTLSHLVDDAENVLHATCASPAVLIGHSMGVRVALELFDRTPHRFRCLILLCGSVFDSLGPIPSRRPLRSMISGTLGLGTVIPSIAGRIKDFTIERDLVSKVGYSLGGLSRSLTPREPVQKLLENVSRLDIRLMSSLGCSYIAHSARHILPRVTLPTLVLVGSNDTLAPPAHARAVARLLPHAEVHVCAGCTHLAPVERPDEVHAVITSFLSRHLS